MLIWMKPVAGVKAVWVQVKLTECATGEPRLWPQRTRLLVWLTLTSVSAPVAKLSAGSASVQAPDTVVPPLGEQLSAPMVAWAPSLPSSSIVNPAVRLVEIVML
jgi:hypothetical protein